MKIFSLVLAVMIISCNQRYYKPTNEPVILINGSDTMKVYYGDTIIWNNSYVQPAGY
jgi:hypothetical protein